MRMWTPPPCGLAATVKGRLEERVVSVRRGQPLPCISQQRGVRLFFDQEADRGGRGEGRRGGGEGRGSGDAPSEAGAVRAPAAVRHGVGSHRGGGRRRRAPTQRPPLAAACEGLGGQPAGPGERPHSHPMTGGGAFENPPLGGVEIDEGGLGFAYQIPDPPWISLPQLLTPRRRYLPDLRFLTIRLFREAPDLPSLCIA